MESIPGRVNIKNFEFEFGGNIPKLELAYSTYGEYKGDNAVLICHALTGSHHVAGDLDDPEVDTSGQAAAWWNGLIGNGKAIDTTKYFVICVNVPGSCYGSTGPSSYNPKTRKPYATDFPRVSVSDWVRAQKLLLDKLGIERLHGIIGPSLGGMNVLEWAKKYPYMVDKLIPVGAGARLDPQCIALDSIARQAIKMDPNWNGGNYYGKKHPKEGLGMARKIGHIMYLSKNSMEQKFGRQTANRERKNIEYTSTDSISNEFPYFEIESYLDYQAKKFVDRFDANSYLYLLRAMDHYDLGRGYKSDIKAIKDFNGSILVVSSTGDWHFTIKQANNLVDVFNKGGADTYHYVVNSDYGHDAFLVELDKFKKPISNFLENNLNKEYENKLYKYN